MKLITTAILALSTFLSSAQPASLVAAEAAARKDGKQILLRFSGSDWCIPCIRLEKAVFEKEVFLSYASTHLVLMQADFPRLPKHKLSKEQQAENEALAALYDKDGSFPLVVLLNPDGSVVKRWEAAAVGTADEFVATLQRLAHD